MIISMLTTERIIKEGTSKMLIEKNEGIIVDYSKGDIKGKKEQRTIFHYIYFPADFIFLLTLPSFFYCNNYPTCDLISEHHLSFYTFSHLIFIKTLEVRYCYVYFTSNETSESKELAQEIETSKNFYLKP